MPDCLPLLFLQCHSLLLLHTVQINDDDEYLPAIRVDATHVHPHDHCNSVAYNMLCTLQVRISTLSSSTKNTEKRVQLSTVNSQPFSSPICSSVQRSIVFECLIGSYDSEGFRSWTTAPWQVGWRTSDTGCWRHHRHWRWRHEVDSPPTQTAAPLQRHKNVSSVRWWP